MTALLFAVAAGALLSFANGANDVSKGIATLVGSGVSDLRRATRMAAVLTGLGALVGAAFAASLLSTFGSGFLTPGTVPATSAAVATLAGAAAWVVLATRFGLPVSTTHAIVGALAGVATAAYGVEAVQWSVVGGKIAVPLLLSPAIAYVVTYIGYRAWRATNPSDCVCAQAAVPAGGPLGAPRLFVISGTEAQCAHAPSGTVRATVSGLHWGTAALTSFARGMNDAPKIAALVLATAGTGSALGVGSAFAVVAAPMVAGSLVAGRRVTTALAGKVTRLDHHQGFVANAVTAGCVASGAFLGLPLSTTHVSTGAIAGAGGAGVDRGTLRTFALAWLVTAPAAALLGVGGYLALRTVLA